MPNAITILDDPSFRAEYFGWWEPSPAQIQILNDGFEQYLNLHQIDLTSGVQVENDYLRFIPFAIELDGDPLPEWIVKADFRVFWASSILFINENEQNQYSTLPSPLPSLTGRYYSDGETTIDTSFDFTNDGINEVTLINWTYLGGGATDQSVEIYTWKNSRLELLEQIDLSYGGWTVGPVYDIADYTGDGVEDIYVQESHSRNFGCEWEQNDLYSWQGLEPQFNLQGEDIPNTPLCNTWRGMPSYWVTPTKQIPFLERALEQLTVETAPSVDYMAFVRLHLAIAYARQGWDSQARVVLDGLYDLPQDARLVSLLVEIYESVYRSPVGLCRNLLARADELINTDIGQYINEGVIMGPGGDFERPYLPFVCPLSDVAQERVENAILPNHSLPEQTIANLDLQLAYTQSINLDGDAETEWFGVLETTEPMPLIFDKVNNVWQVSFLTIRPLYPILEVQFDMQDVTNDGLPEVVVIVKQDMAGVLYGGGDVEYVVFVVQKQDNIFQAIEVASAPTQPDLATIGNLFASDPPRPGWWRLKGFTPEDTYIYDYIGELTTAVLSQERPFSLPADLTTLITYLPADDPEAQLVINQLTYMLGYYHELEGNNEQAIAAYLQLIQQAPVSPWSWLAWARLEPIP